MYYAENPLTNVESGQIRLQYHGENEHTRFTGELDQDQVVAALGDMLTGRSTPRRVDAIPDTLLANEIFVLTTDDLSGSTNYRAGLYAVADVSGTLTPRLVMLPTEEAFARLLPPIPEEGSRDGKFARWVGNTLQWITATTGISTDQIARLLPELPEAGSRDGKIPKFNNDDLEWQEDGGEADPPAEWSVGISPNFIVRPGFEGTYTVFIHNLATDEDGFDDVANILVRLQGLAVLSQAWTAASGARTLQFTISPTNSQNLARTHATNCLLYTSPSPRDS